MKFDLSPFPLPDCEDCRSYFANKCEVHGPPLFIADTPVPMGTPDRAMLTLPPGLEVGKSDIPDAGLGVFSKGAAIPLGAHYGPCEGDLVDREEAMNSAYSWVVSLFLKVYFLMLIISKDHASIHSSII